MKHSKILILVLACIMVVIASCSVYGAGATDKQIVKEYCNKHYKGYTIKYFTKWNEKKICSRKGKHIIYVQIETSISSGKKDKCNNRYWGYIKGQHYYKTWYNTKVKKGKEVKSYYIYNPYTNYYDDIVAVVDNKKIR